MHFSIGIRYGQVPRQHVFPESQHSDNRTLLGGVYEFLAIPQTFDSAVPVAPNIKIRLKAQNYIPIVSLHDLLRENFTFTFTS
jgi:hypothetical protein